MDKEVSNDTRTAWPLRPMETALALQGLCMLLADLVQRDLDLGVPMPRRRLLEMNGVTAAMEVFADELAHWFSTRPEQDHEQLEEMQNRYVNGQA